jgi:hypothetical protein
MKAIYISQNFNPKNELDQLNKELKNVYSVESEINFEYGARLLIVSEHTRADKLKKLNEIANERTDNNSI